MAFSNGLELSDFGNYLQEIFMAGKSYSELEVPQALCHNDERVFW
jgi:hypothetical protein